MTFRPMLAETCESIESLPLPGYISPKLDGIRCVILNGKALTRKLKPIPNRFVREYLESHPELDGLDGELMVEGSFNDVQSAIMSEDGEPDFVFHVFDVVNQLGQKSFAERLGIVKFKVSTHLQNGGCRVSRVDHDICHTHTEVRDLHASNLAAGYEGSMYRHPDGLYKHGRSTLRQSWLLKIKEWQDSEARIVSVQEQMENTNEAEVNELGLTKRSTAKSGMVGKGVMGKFEVDWNGVKFSIGTGEGLTHGMRRAYWESRDTLVGQLVKFKYFGVFPDSGEPRFPIILGIRHGDDV